MDGRGKVRLSSRPRAERRFDSRRPGSILSTRPTTEFTGEERDCDVNCDWQCVLLPTGT